MNVLTALIIAIQLPYVITLLMALTVTAESFMKEMVLSVKVGMS